MKTKAKSTKPRGETWVGVRPVAFPNKKKQKNKNACRKGSWEGGY